MRFTIDIDTGGTFTDGFFADYERGEIQTIKVLTTPHDLTLSFLDCIERAAEHFGLPLPEFLRQTGVVRLSSTVVTNAILQRHGMKVGVLVTAGREAHLYGPDDGEPPLIRHGYLRPGMVAGIEEETGDRGEVLRAPVPVDVLARFQGLVDAGAQAVVVCLANGSRNPANELAAKGIVKSEYPNHYLGWTPVFAASELSRRPGDAGRLNAAFLAAYVHAHVARFLYRAEEKLRRKGYRRPLLVVHGNGGVSRVAKTHALQTYNSGPVAGVLGACELARRYELRRAISIDIGGTSVDIGVIRDGRAHYDLESQIGGLKASLPTVRVAAVGGAGGSIVRLEAEGELAVGPDSAGALPGPACFGLGGSRPTVTDADLLLGYLDPNRFLGGRMRLDVERAAAAFDPIARRLGCSLDEAAWQAKIAVDRASGAHVRRLAREAGFTEEDLSEATLVVYGGAGPVHAAEILRSAGVAGALVTPHAPVFSAASLSSMDVLHVYSESVERELGARSPEAERQWLDATIRPLLERARDDMRGEGFELDAVRLDVEVVVDTPGGEVAVIVPRPVLEHPQHVQELAERCRSAVGLGDGTPVRVAQVILRASAGIPHSAMPTTAAESAGENPSGARKGERSAYWGPSHGRVATPVFDRARLPPGSRLAGPALVEGGDTTSVIAPGLELQVDARSNELIVPRT